MQCMERKKVMAMNKGHAQAWVVKCFVHVCLIFAPALAGAADIQYYKAVGLRGALAEK